MDNVTQLLMRGAAGAGDSTFIDDVFSTYAYLGNGSNRNIVNGVDNTEGGLIWTKARTANYAHILVDTERGTNKYLSSSGTAAEVTDAVLTSFNNNGYGLSGSADVNRHSNYPFVGWNFRKAKGFFDIVTYTGNGTGGTSISHNLGSIPGMMIVKKASGTGNWAVYHRKKGANYITYLNLDSGGGSTGNMWWNTEPTSTHFTVGADNDTNANGATYVAYLFAGGSATQQYSVKTNAGSSNYMSVPTHSDLNLDGDFTVEFWHKRTTTGTTKLFSYGNAATNAGIEWYYNSSNVQKIYINATEYEFPNGTQSPAYKWVHYAISRQGTNTRVFVDGRLMTTYASHSSTITGAIITGNQWAGSITAEDGAYWSNLRVVKGTAVYTAAFTPPQSALTNITNTKLLCWNSSTTTGATVSPVTIAQNGTVTSESDTPSYSDPNCFLFGEEGDKNIVATGSYEGNGSSDGPEINLGWEPQWVIIKNTSAAVSWHMFDSMRGIPTGSSDARLESDGDGAEFSNSNSTYNYLDLTPTGFKIKTTPGWVNSNGETYIYMCIRRPDGYVGKPAEAGTDVFAMDTGAGSSTIPNFDSGFPVDLSLVRNPTSSASWWAGTRLTSGREIKVNGTDVPSTWQYGVYDSNVGWQNYSSHGSSEMSWMWKRHAGFDLVTYKGNGAAGATFGHSLGRTPEMMWVRGLGPNAANWYVYHTGMDNANRRTMNLETIDAQTSESTGRWNDTFPTATHFTVGVNANNNGDEYIAMLFASVDGISSLGRYDGSNYNITITTGFSPRFILIKGYDANSYGRHWIVMDSLRGINPGGNTDYLYLENSAAQNNGGPEPYISAISSTGFTLLAGKGDTSASNRKYIYYAHA